MPRAELPDVPVQKQPVNGLTAHTFFTGLTRVGILGSHNKIYLPIFLYMRDGFYITDISFGYLEK